MKIVLFAVLLISASPAAALTSSTDLENIAKTLEQNPAGNSTLNNQLLTLLREPAKTLDGVTLPTTAAQYTTSTVTALKLRPKGWLAGTSEQPPSAGVNCVAQMAYWNGTLLPTDTFAWGKGNCASVLSAAIARAWAWKLRQIGR